MEQNKRKSRRITLQIHQGIGLSLLSMALIGIVCGFYYHSIKDIVFNAYVEKGFIATTLAARQVSGDDVRRYMAQGYLDKSFMREKDPILRTIKREFSIQYFYLFIPEKDRLVYVYGASNEGDDEYSKVYLGQAEEYMDKAIIQKVVKNGKTEPSLDINSDEKYGELASVYSPVFDHEGRVTAIFGADFSMNFVIAQIWEDVVEAAFWVVLAVITLILLYSYNTQRCLILPIKRLTVNVQNFVNRRSDLTTGNALEFASVEIEGNNELSDLAEACHIMAVDIKTYVANLQSVTAAKQAIETELNVAKNIQEMLLPHIFPPFTEDDHFSIYATIEAAKSVGGDYYDFYCIDDDHVCFTIADVSGKGVPAALFMVIAKTIMKNQAFSKLCPNKILAAANNQLNEDNDEGMFVTAFIGILELSTGRLSYSNAGHNPPLIRCQNGEFGFLPVDRNLVLAIMDDVEFTLQEMTLVPGDLLFLYTDGVTEAMDEYHQQYTEARLLDCLNMLGAKTDDLTEFLRGVRVSLSAHVGAAPQSDDITMMAVRLDGYGVLKDL